MQHNHGSHHGHDHSPQRVTTAFALAALLNLAFVVVEAACGFLTGSLALLSDAGHNLSDVLGLLLAWGASYLARQAPSPRRTYGLRRTSILAALANAILLLIAVGAIAWEALSRLQNPQPLLPLAVMIVAGIGVFINTLTALMFFSDQHRDINVRGAFLHLAADAAVSLGVLIGGLVISRTGWLWIDPALSLVIAAVIAVSTWSLLSQALDLALDSVPRGIDPDAVRTYLGELPGVSEVHDLHIWGLSTTEVALTVHLVRPAATVDDDWLHGVAHQLLDRFGIHHATIQVESGIGANACRLAPHDVV